MCINGKTEKTMKKILLLSAAAAFALSACTGELNPEITPDQDGDSVENTQPEVLPGEYKDYIFSSLITKTSMQDGGSILWSEGDRIKVIYEGGESISEPAQIEDNMASARFKVSLPSDLALDTRVYAVYPADAKAVLSEGVLNVTIPQNQSAKFESANIVAAATTPGAANLYFRQVCSFLSFEVSEGNSKNISKAYFTDLYGTAVAGTVSLSFNEEGMVIGEATGTSTEINLRDVTEGTNYIAVLPDTELKSIAVKLGTDDSWYTPIASDTDHTAEKGLVKPLGALDAAVKDAFYVNSVKELEALLDCSNEWNKMCVAFKLDGNVIKVAEGEYKLTSILKPAPSKETTFSIIGNELPTFDATTSKKAFEITTNTNITFKNLKFANATTSGISLTGGKHNFISCTFHKNSSQGNGGGLWISTADVNFDDCTFTVNEAKSYGGGAIYMNSGDTADKTITINNCLFGGNVSDDSTVKNQAKEGGAIYLTNCIAKVTDCRFYKNTLSSQPTDAANGAVVYLGDRIDASFDNCDFRSNWGGALRNNGTYTLEGRKVALNNCLFLSNVCRYRGGAIRATGSTPLFLNNCQFYNNKANGQGGHLSQQDGKSFIGINNCTFYRGTNFNENNTSDKADTWMNGKSVIVNSSFVGSYTLVGNGAPLVLRYSDNFDGSILANNVIFPENNTSGYWGSPRFSVNDSANDSWRVYGYYNLMNGIAGTSKLYSGSNDVTGGIFSGIGGTGSTADNVIKIDYTKNDGIPKPTLKQIEEAIRGTEGNLKGGNYEAFYQWLLTVDGLTKDGFGNTRTDANNRPGSLVK